MNKTNKQVQAGTAAGIIGAFVWIATNSLFWGKPFINPLWGLFIVVMCVAVSVKKVKSE
jgi:hypothetical protein